MGRWLRAYALGAVTVLALTGCGGPAGGDGDPVDDRAEPTRPATFQPENGRCHPFDQETSDRSTYRPVDCAREHQAETLHVGTFTGEHAARDLPPPYASPSWAVAHAECDRTVATVLGADWRTARLDLAVVLPTAGLWREGARWYRCDVAEITNVDDETVESRTGSLRGALKGPNPLSLGCFSITYRDSSIDGMTPVSCTERHDTEFVGVLRAEEDTFESFQANAARAERRCLHLIADYAKLPRDSTLAYRARTILHEPSESEWKYGDRGVRCFLWHERPSTRSVRGGGAKALPVRFR